MYPADGERAENQTVQATPLAPGPPVIGASSSQAFWQLIGPIGLPITVPYGQTATVKVDGATAAYSLEAGIARAAANGGVVTLVGRATGTTHVVVTTGSGVEYLRVTVSDPPITVLSGFTASGAPSSEIGTLDLRYGSELGLLESSVRLLRREGHRTVELAVSAAIAIARRESRSFSLPLLSYTVRSPRRTVTLMDSVVANSPLTLARSNVRGLHWQEGPWQAHAGYSFFGTFEHLLLPAEREAVAGISYQQRLGASSTLTPNLYYYRSSARTTAEGVAGTAVLETRPFQSVQALTEVGVGGGTGAAAVDIQVSRPNLQAWTTARFAPEALPTLSSDQPAGRQIEAGLTRQAGSWRIDARASSQQFRVGDSDQSSHVARLNLTHLFARVWQVQAGSFFSVFDAAAPARPKVRNLGVPIGLAVTAGPIGAGIDYQWSREPDRDQSGHLVRASLSVSRLGFSAALSAERQTQTPTLAAVFSEEPALQRELDRLGIAATTPEQLAEVLRTNASLSALGYASSVNVDLTPIRDRIMGRFAWAGTGRLQPKFEFSSMANRDVRATRMSHTAVHTATASARVATGTEASLSWSVVCPDRPLPDRQCQPALMASLRQQIGRTAGLLSTGSSGDISGVVFRDDERLGRYGRGMATLAGYEVLLDGVQRTQTDAAGNYRFRRVRAGRHRVEVRLPDDTSLFFTTPSPVDTEAGKAANFGVAAARSRLRVIVASDAETPLGGVVLRATDGAKAYTLTTGADGVAPFDGLDAGTYDVQLEAASLPAGYFMSQAAPHSATIAPNLPGLISVVVRAARSVAGSVRTFDARVGGYVPAAAVVVELRSTGQRAVTDTEGRYVFRDLPPGEHTVVAGGPGQTFSIIVRLPVGPATVTGIDLTLAPERPPK